MTLDLGAQAMDFGIQIIVVRAKTMGFGAQILDSGAT